MSTCVGAWVAMPLLFTHPKGVCRISPVAGTRKATYNTTWESGLNDPLFKRRTVNLRSKTCHLRATLKAAS
jgi:hypothetical protein